MWESLETGSDTVATLTPAALRHEPLAAFLERLRASSRVDLNDAQRAAERYLRPEARIVVIVGDAAVLPSLETLGLGEIVVHRKD
jgi:hypothetical protein